MPGDVVCGKRSLVLALAPLTCCIIVLYFWILYLNPLTWGNMLLYYTLCVCFLP